MGNRGRRSAAEIADTNVASIERPAPPAWLSDAERQEWEKVIQHMPPDWATRERYPLVEAYCTHAVSRREAAKKLKECWADEEGDPRVAKVWSEIHAKDSGQLKSLAIRLEIAQSTSYERNRSNQSNKKKPWKM